MVLVKVPPMVISTELKSTKFSINPKFTPESPITIPNINSTMPPTIPIRDAKSILSSPSFSSIYLIYNTCVYFNTFSPFFPSYFYNIFIFRKGLIHTRNNTPMHKSFFSYHSSGFVISSDSAILQSWYLTL